MCLKIFGHSQWTLSATESERALPYPDVALASGRLVRVVGDSDCNCRQRFKEDFVLYLLYYYNVLFITFIKISKAGNFSKPFVSDLFQSHISECFNLEAPCVMYIGTDVSLFFRERFLYI